MSRALLAAALLTAALTPCLAAADEQQAPAAPSMLEPLRGVADAYARGLDRCYGFPTGTAVMICSAERWWKWMHAPTNNGAVK